MKAPTAKEIKERYKKETKPKKAERKPDITERCDHCRERVDVSLVKFRKWCHKYLCNNCNTFLIEMKKSDPEKFIIHTPLQNRNMICRFSLREIREIHSGHLI